MPIGYLIAVAVAAVPVLIALRPLRRSGRLGRISWLASMVVNESPFLAVYWVVAATLLAFAQHDLATPVGWIGLGLACVTVAGLPVLVARSLRARPAVERALDENHGAGWRSRVDPASRPPWGRILLAPLPLRPRAIERVSDLSYGDAGKLNRLDVYRIRSRPPSSPILIHLHGGGFRGGRKSFEGRPLVHRFARRGWVCISANYRLRPDATFPDYLVDAKKVIAWARAHADELGADPSRVVVAGDSAGAHLAVMAALTAGDPRFQPGFDDADTSVAAAVGLYGYYGPVDVTRQTLPSSPGDYAHPGAPPILIAHGDQDTLVPPDGPRAIAEKLRGVSVNPVVYVELPGAQHTFDLVHSLRCEALVDGVEAFVALLGIPVGGRPEPAERGIPTPRRFR